jgi:hypothetical protein
MIPTSWHFSRRREMSLSRNWSRRSRSRRREVASRRRKLIPICDEHLLTDKLIIALLPIPIPLALLASAPLRKLLRRLFIHGRSHVESTHPSYTISSRLDFVHHLAYNHIQRSKVFGVPYHLLSPTSSCPPEARIRKAFMI